MFWSLNVLLAGVKAFISQNLGESFPYPILSSKPIGMNDRLTSKASSAIQKVLGFKWSQITGTADSFRESLSNSE